MDEPKKRPDRSPNHPYLSLKAAVEKAKLLFDKYGKQPAPMLNAVKTMGYKSVYSTTHQVIAALKSYGLVELQGSGDFRKVAVSEVGQRICRNAPDRNALLKIAALAPQIHKDVLEYFPDGLPNDELLTHYLVWDRPENSRFNEITVGEFIQRLRETLLFANINSNDKESSEISDGHLGESVKNEHSPEALLTSRVQVGSYVQWTSNGTDQFPVPRKVVGVQGEWAFVEGSPTGVPVSELAVIDPPATTKVTTAPPSNPFSKIEMEPQKISGPFICWPLSGGNRFELRLEKPISKKDFERLKKLIDLSEDSLVEGSDE